LGQSLLGGCAAKCELRCPTGKLLRFLVALPSVRDLLL
jgi:hypothetical protein